LASPLGAEGGGLQRLVSSAIGVPPSTQTGGNPIGGLESLFNIGGAPIAVLGGLLSAGLPIGGPVAQIFVGGGPMPNILFLSTVSPGGPIGQFEIGSGGAPIGVATLGGGGLPIGIPPGVAAEIGALQARVVSTILVPGPNPQGIGSGGRPIGFL
jgi:hypothetical protein